MKRITILIMLAMVLTGCGGKKQKEELHKPTSDIKNHQQLVEKTDLKLTIKVLDDLTAENSFDGTLRNQTPNDDSFYSERKIEIIDAFGASESEIAAVGDKVYVREAILEGTHHRYEATRSLIKDKEYIVYVSFSEVLGGYEIPLFESAIVSFDADVNKTENGLSVWSDFVTLLSTKSDISQMTLDNLEKGNPSPGISDYADPISKTIKIGDITYQLLIVEREDNKVFIELEGHQFIVDGKVEL